MPTIWRPILARNTSQLISPFRIIETRSSGHPCEKHHLTWTGSREETNGLRIVELEMFPRGAYACNEQGFIGTKKVAAGRIGIPKLHVGCVGTVVNSYTLSIDALTGW